MRTGKLSQEELQHLVLDRLPRQADTIMEGPGIGLDCAAVVCRDGYLLITSDPITGAASDIGRLAVHVSCNDVAACGIRPSILMLVLIAPPDCSPEDISQIIDQASAAAAELDVSIAGGHTEVSDAVSRFVIVTTAIGFTHGSRPVLAHGARAGDALLMTKTAGLEGTAILASDQRRTLSCTMPEQALDQAAAMIGRISVVAEGVLAGRLGVHAMHDATEGGILGACWELAEASGLGCLIDTDAIPVDPLTRQICAILELDPLRLISSGSLLMATDQPEPLIEALAQQGIRCTCIGRLTADSSRRYSHRGQLAELMPPGPDELYKTL